MPFTKRLLGTACALLCSQSATHAFGQTPGLPDAPAAPALFHTSLLTPPGAFQLVDPQASSLPRSSVAPSQPDTSSQEYRSIDQDGQGSTIVPMDSWVYPALERLANMGLIPSQNVAIRPWTRQECRRQVREAEDLIYGFAGLDTRIDAGTRSQAERILPDLEAFLHEPDTRDPVILDSAYVRFGSILGPALTDGFHFGQTWRNDYGRPLGRGGSLIAGYAIRATAGRFFFYNRQELQTDPGVRAVSQAQSDFISSLDNTFFGSTPPSFSVVAPARTAYTRTRPLALYAGAALGGYNLSFGKQEIYWGPTTMGPWSFSNNAEPTYNLRFVSARPHAFPFLPQLGSYNLDLVFGKLSGHHYPARSYFNGQKLDLTFAKYLEMSVTRWSILWGVGHPMTLGSLKRNIFSSNSTGSVDYGAYDDPGDRKAGFDFRLHVPGVSNFVTIYGDAYSDDDLNPVAAPRRNPWQAGIYIARLPRMDSMDFRLEMSTSEELSQDEGGRRSFINNQYRDGNTNKGFLLGNAVGRDGRALEGRLGYWLTARNRVEVGYRQTKISSLFLTSGGTISDAFVSSSYALSKEWTASLFSQYERFLVPSFMNGRQTNGSLRFQITWTPQNAVIGLHHP